MTANCSVLRSAVSGILDPEIRYHELVRCFRCEGAECPKCGGSGFRERKRCAGCGVPAGRPSQGGKALQPERGAKSQKERRSLLLYCKDCNPRFSGAGLALFFEGMSG